MTSNLDHEGWPVTTQEPFDLVQEEGLVPGPALQACSGSDIILARGASMKANPAKQKGRYVCLLPGILSLRTMKASATATNAATSAPEEKKEEEDEKGETSATMTQETDEPDSLKSSDDIKPASKPSATSLLGRIEGLSTNNPTLTIPYPNGGMLTFKGKKVDDSSSRFMMLSFKRGQVSCKDAVSSVICFGEATYSGPEAEGVELEELVHYGGSDRTVDGGKAVKLKKGAGARTVVNTSQLTIQSVLGSKKSALSNAKSKTKMASKSSPPAPSTKDAVLVDSDNEEEGEDSDAYMDDEGPTFKQTTTSSRRSSRRSTSSKKSYIDSEEEDSDEDDEDEEEKPAKKKPTRKRAAKKYLVDSDDDEKVKHAKNQPAQKRSAQSKAVIEIDDDSDDRPVPEKPARKRALPKTKAVVESGDDDGEMPAPKKPTRKRAPPKSKKPVEVESGDQLEEDKEERPMSQESSKPSRQSSRRSIFASKKSYFEDEKSDDYEESEEEKKQKKLAQKKVMRKPACKPQDIVEVDKDFPEPLSQLSETSRPRSRRRASTKKSYKDEDDEEDDDDVSHSEEEKPPPAKKTTMKRKVEPKITIAIDDNSEAENELPKKKSVTRRKKGQAASKPIDVVDDVKAASAEISSTRKSVNKQVKSPGGRRRRRRSDVSPAVASKQKSTPADTTKSDDSFGIFDFGADDDAIMTTPEKRVNRLKKNKSKAKVDPVDLTM